VQLDNQLAECLYPVIAAPVPPPKSVMAESVPKPFLELAVLEYTSPEHTDIKQYKYVHALVQELQLKVRDFFISVLRSRNRKDSHHLCGAGTVTRCGSR
jgi:vacuolar protein sorting-associated protein 13A/C